MEKVLKNQQLLDSLSVDCPDEDSVEKETNAFRWVFDDLEDERDFRPQYLKYPKRFNNKPPAVICQSLGISMFDTAENAIEKFNFLKRQLGGKAYKSLGTKLPKGFIQPIFGLTDEPNKKGHFNHYPFEEIELKMHFTIIENL